MLQLKNITKDYVVNSELTVHALKGVSLNFRANEFVSILGPSGCGKTTLLNIVGGLDRYTDGDLIINGKSTKGFRDHDWDAYRNRSIGFVFQSYNLIPHMNVLDNVTLSLSLAGASKAERIEKAKIALEKVGLAEQIKKRPNQLSGGQMQRVAIARAIVNDPDIILADEPTGALDTETGVQVMELLKEIANDRLVIMVTHNPDLAERYSTRIIRMLDGELTSDTNPYTDKQLEDDTEAELLKKELSDEEPSTPEKNKSKKVSMSALTAFSISAKNLWSKKGRTFLTSFAGSIGIFGITLVLAVSAGMTKYVNNMQTEALGDSAITISETTFDLNSMYGAMDGLNPGEAYPTTSGVRPYQNMMVNMQIHNDLSEEYVNYVLSMDSSWTKTIDFTYSVNFNVVHKVGDTYQSLPNWTSSSLGMVTRTNSSQMVNNGKLVEENYDVLYKSDSSETGYPKDYTEVSLVVDSYNRLQLEMLEDLGFAVTKNNDGSYKEISYSDIVDKEYYVICNDGWYVENNGVFRAKSSAEDLEEAANGQHVVTLKIVSILRSKNDDATRWLSSGLVYLPSLSDFMIENAVNSEVGKAQIKAGATKSVLTGLPFMDMASYTKEEMYVATLKSIGAYANPVQISISPTDINTKKQITNHLDAWNEQHPDSKVVYNDFAAIALSALSTLIDVITYVLVAFSAVSLVVSTVMISVITYTSVIERIKEIGVLRSIGARKKDISSIFNAETAMIGTFAGIIGILFAVLVGIIVNAILYAEFEVVGIVQFTPVIILVMLALSIGLTLIAGLIPSRIAANKDPVTCLRTE